jgi:5-methylcytosine-specific restriction endonuclease McrA
MSSEYVPVALKQLVFDRARGLCEYCRSQAKYAIAPLVIDHIQPVSRGGQTIADNLALSCQTCNNYKLNKTEAIDLATGQLAPLFNPRLQGMEPAFHLERRYNSNAWYYSNWTGNGCPTPNQP